MSDRGRALGGGGHLCQVALHKLHLVPRDGEATVDGGGGEAEHAVAAVVGRHVEAARDGGRGGLCG